MARFRRRPRGPGRRGTEQEVSTHWHSGDVPPRPDHDVEIGPELVRRLLRRQQPDLASRPLVVAASGWDNVTVRVGDDLAARLPRRRAAATLILHEQRWLPELAARLPLPVPVPQHLGRPDEGYPYAWSVVPWLDGVPAVTDAGAFAEVDAEEVARSLASFLVALHVPSPDAAPANPVRGIPLAARAAIDARHAVGAGVRLDRDDLDDLLAAIGEGRAAPSWPSAPRWIHGDLHPGNLLLAEGRLAAVLDFGDLTAGDPATDLAVTWMLLPADARSAFWDAYTDLSGHHDRHLKVRARGWAASLALAFLANSDNDPMVAAIGTRTADGVTSR